VRTLQERGIDARVLENDIRSWGNMRQPLAVGREP
jgi:hypothetical protein